MAIKIRSASIVKTPCPGIGSNLGEDNPNGMKLLGRSGFVAREFLQWQCSNHARRLLREPPRCAIAGATMGQGVCGERSSGGFGMISNW